MTLWWFRRYYRIWCPSQAENSAHNIIYPWWQPIAARRQAKYQSLRRPFGFCELQLDWRQHMGHEPGVPYYPGRRAKTIARFRRGRKWW